MTFEKKLYLGDCQEIIPKIEWQPVNLVVTSPPYNARQEYEGEMTEEEYCEFILGTFKLIKKVLAEDGRVAWVVAPTISEKGKELPFPLEYLSIKAALEAGLNFWESIVWDQGHTEAQTAWGSWQSSSAPYIRHKTERVLLFTKNGRKRQTKGESNKFGEKEFEHSTLDMWQIAPTQDPVHPCPFPLKLALRCVKLFSYKGDVVLDPFMGSGTTGEACKIGRKFIGIEKDPNYFKRAKERLISLHKYI